MFKFIERLRAESESHRKRTALIVSFSLTGVVFMFWFMAFSGNTTTVTYNQATSASSSPLAAVGEVLETGTDLVGDFLNNFREAKAILFEAASTSSATSTGN